MLVHLVDLAPLEGEPVANYEAVREELAAYGSGLERLPELVVLSKRDLVEAGAVEAAVAEWRSRLAPAHVSGDGSDRTAGPGEPIDVLAVSAATREGVEELRRRILAELPEKPATGRSSAVGESGLSTEAGGSQAGAAEFEAEHRVYRPVGEGGYSVEREEDGGFRVLGRGVELLVERHDLANEEALAYLEQRLNEIGVVAALRAAGFEPGDEVRIGAHEFALHP